MLSSIVSPRCTLILTRTAAAAVLAFTWTAATAQVVEVKHKKDKVEYKYIGSDGDKHRATAHYDKPGEMALFQARGGVGPAWTYQREVVREPGGGVIEYRPSRIVDVKYDDDEIEYRYIDDDGKVKKAEAEYDEPDEIALFEARGGVVNRREVRYIEPRDETVYYEYQTPEYREPEPSREVVHYTERRPEVYGWYYDRLSDRVRQGVYDPADPSIVPVAERPREHRTYVRHEYEPRARYYGGVSVGGGGVSVYFTMNRDDAEWLERD